MNIKDRKGLTHTFDHVWSKLIYLINTHCTEHFQKFIKYRGLLQLHNFPGWGSIYLFHPEESHPCEQWVGSGLMLPSDPLQLQLIGYFLQASLQHKYSRRVNPVSSSDQTGSNKRRGYISANLETFTALHQVLDVVDCRKKQVEDLKEVVLLLRKPSISQKLHQIAKVITAEKSKMGMFITILTNHGIHLLGLEKNLKTANLWKESHLTFSQSTRPDVMRSSAKYSVSIPSSSCFLNWRPEFCSRSIESCEYMSSLRRRSTSHYTNNTKCSSSKDILFTLNHQGNGFRPTWGWIWSWTATLSCPEDKCRPRSWTWVRAGWSSGGPRCTSAAGTGSPPCCETLRLAAQRPQGTLCPVWDVNITDLLKWQESDTLSNLSKERKQE